MAKRTRENGGFSHEQYGYLRAKVEFEACRERVGDRYAESVEYGQRLRNFSVARWALLVWHARAGLTYAHKYKRPAREIATLEMLLKMSQERTVSYRLLEKNAQLAMSFDPRW